MERLLSQGLGWVARPSGAPKEVGAEGRPRLETPQGCLAERWHPGPTQTSYPRTPHRGPCASVNFPGHSGGQPRVGLAALGKEREPSSDSALALGVPKMPSGSGFLPAQLRFPTLPARGWDRRAGVAALERWPGQQGWRREGGPTSGARGQVAGARGGRVEEASSRVAWVVPADGGVGGCPGEDAESVGKAVPSSLGPPRQPAASVPGQGCSFEAKHFRERRVACQRTGSQGERGGRGPERWGSQGAFP